MQFLTNERYGNGSDGALSITGADTDAPTDSACTGTSGETALTATNASFAANQIILIHQTGAQEGAWELNAISSYVAGTITTKYNLANTYAAGSQVLVVEQHTTISVSNSVIAKAWNGTVGGVMAFLANTSITVSGTATTEGRGYLGGTHGGTTNTDDGYRGAGTGGDNGTRQHTANGNGGGGGDANGAGSQGGGAGGGNGAVGTAGGAGTGGSVASTGGEAKGVADLSTMVFGGGGGGTGGEAGKTAGAGKAGSAIVVLISPSIVVTGAVSLPGVVGENGAGSPNAHGGGGGGAGGSCLIKGDIIDIGTNKIAAPGGAGGTATADAGVGGAGAVGRIYVEYGTSITGSTSTPANGSGVNSNLIVMKGAFLQNFI